MFKAQVPKHLPGAKDVSREERLPEERWRMVGVLGSLRGKRSEELTQLKTFPHENQKYLLSPRGDDGS